MFVINNSRHLFDTAGEGDGSAGAGSVLTSPQGGGGSAAPKGDAHSSQGGAGGGGNPGASAPAGGAPQDWKSSLPDELRNEAGLGMFKDVSALAKSFLHAQKMIGADKIPVPGKHATDEDWKNVFSKLGLPQDVKDYEVKFQEGVTIDKEFSEAFKQQAHAAGILPKQAQALADWFSKANQTAEAQMGEAFKAKQTQELEGLKTEWGAAFEQKIEKARQVVNELGSPELSKYLEQSGLGNDVRLIKLFSELGTKFLSEGKEVGSRSNNEPVMTPADARKEHTSIMSDMSHPYWQKDHPGHKAAVAEVAHLFKMMNPAKSAVDKTF